MKIQTQHLVRLQNWIVPLDTVERREQYRTGDFPRSERVINLNQRYRWDLFWLTPHEFRSELCEYLNDDHLDTALRKIVPLLVPITLGGE